jgi:uncharacterized coiled-coil protein SlyX
MTEAQQQFKETYKDSLAVFEPAYLGIWNAAWQHQQQRIEELQEQLADRQTDLTFEFNRANESESRALEESNKYEEYCDLAEKRIDELEKKLAEVSKNSERYKILKDNLFCADFLYGEDEISVLVFEWNHRVSADLDFTIDEALKQIEVK